MIRVDYARSLFLLSLAAGLSVLAAGGFVVGQSDATKLQAGQLMREGTQIESRPAVCRFNGQRLSVEIEGLERQLVALENLAAQRILEAIRDDPSDDHWLLNGVITEYLGTNYLLLERVKRAPADGEH